MRYRALDTTGDMSFGRGAANFLVNTPDAVAQAVKTRLLLLRGEWFLDVSEGTPYSTEVLGTGTQPLYDMAIRERILGTEGVVEITRYSSALDRNARSLAITATISTKYGATEITAVL